MKKLIANLFNPHEQSKEELIKSFVVRLKVFNKLFWEIKSSDMKYPEQHILIVGQRGMGKTTLLLRLSYEVENDDELNTWLVPIILKEEAYYGIRRLFRLWETIAYELESADTAFSGLFGQMENAYNEDTDYERICFKILINALETHSRKIIVFIDNLGEMFQNFSEMECHRLREILMGCPCLRIVGASTVVLEAFFQYKHAFYEFFKKEQLNILNKQETHHLLLELAKNFKEEKNIRAIIENQPGRVETLRIMTGGVIRSIVLLFEIFTDQKEGNSISDLDNILDRVTPLYQDRMKDLTPLQRDVVNAIALNWDAMSIEEIAAKTRMKIMEIQTVISELEKVNIIQRVVADTRLNLYHLKERFFNIWYLMRLGPRGSEIKVIWLVRFLESWYDEYGLVQRAKKHIQAITKGGYHPKAAYYLTEALARTCKLDMDVEHDLIRITKEYLAEKDKSLAADLSPSDKDLLEKGDKYYWNKEFEKALNLFLRVKNKNEPIYLRIGYSFSELNNFDKALEFYLKALENKNKIALFSLGYLYHYKLRNYEKAEEYYLQAADRGYVAAMVCLGRLYSDELKEYKKAEKYFLLAANREHVDAMFQLGWLYKEYLNESQKAEKYYSMAVEKVDHEISNIENLNGLNEDEKHNIIWIDKAYSHLLNNLAWFYFEQKLKKQEALKYAEQSLEKDKNMHNTHTLACIYLWHENIEEAVHIAKEFMYDEKSYEEIEKYIIMYIMLILAKKKYQYVTEYFEHPDLNLKERFKPLYYALLHFTGHKDYHKIPAELTEPVSEIIEKVRQMAEDYS